MSARYTVHGYNACNGRHLAIVTDAVPNQHGVPQRTLLDRGYSLGEAMVLASWLESRAGGYVAPDALPIRGIAP
jgi:hypothetical protein